MAPVKYIGGNAIQTDAVMRARDPNDYYKTEETCIRGYFKQYPLYIKPKTYLDVGAGDGVWGRTVRSVHPTIDYVAGVELQEEFSLTDARTGYDTWVTADYLSLDTPWDYPGLDEGFDLVGGNPPYKYAEAFFHKSKHYVHRNGVIVFLLRLGFLASERRYDTMWTKGSRPTMVTVLNTRPSFTGDGKTYPGDFAIFNWTFVDGSVVEACEINFCTYDR